MAEGEDRPARQIPRRRLRQRSLRGGRPLPWQARGRGTCLYGKGRHRLESNDIQQDQEGVRDCRQSEGEADAAVR